jgi:hypothetical protein
VRDQVVEPHRLEAYDDLAAKTKGDRQGGSEP